MNLTAEAVARALTGDHVIRTLGLYQPYATLMLPPYNKVETRWVQVGKKPPFKEGWYLIYSTLKAYKREEWKHIAGCYADDVSNKLYYEQNETGAPRTDNLYGYAIGLGYLENVEPYSFITSPDTFVDVKMEELQDVAGQDPNSNSPDIVIDGRGLWRLEFRDMKRIKPFQFKGKQGVGILRWNEAEKIKFIDH